MEEKGRGGRGKVDTRAVAGRGCSRSEAGRESSSAVAEQQLYSL